MDVLQEKIRTRVSFNKILTNKMYILAANSTTVSLETTPLHKGTNRGQSVKMITLSI